MSGISIKLRCASWQQLSAMYKRDLSRNAIFLRSANPPARGTPVRIDLMLPSESLIVLSGVVANHVPAGGLDGRGPGVDIQLGAIPQSAMWLIETALASAKKDSEPQPRSPRPAEAAVDDHREQRDAEAELLAALAAEQESLQKLNPFQVLGVGYSVTDDEVRAAFGELTKRYHPDRYARYQSQELRARASEIFILIRDAYRRIGNEASRKQVMAQLPPPTQRPRAGNPPASTPASTPSASRGGPPRPPPSAASAPASPPPAAPRAEPETASLSAAAKQAKQASAAIPEKPPAAPPLGDPIEEIDELLNQDKIDQAWTKLQALSRGSAAKDRPIRVMNELIEGLRALGRRDRLEAAQRFESVLEHDPSNERAARELAEMRRQATNERKGLLSRLITKKE